MRTLSAARVFVFGIGGVGSYCAEALARAGIGNLVFIDSDTVESSNINRQLIALTSTVGKYKAELMKSRALDINPDACVTAICKFFNAENAGEFDLSGADYIVDAIDSVPSKLLLIETAKKSGIPIISCMGAGNKLDPTKFVVSDIENTAVCPLAKVIRKALRERGITGVKVVYSTEPPKKQNFSAQVKPLTASAPFVPGVAGLIIAGEVIKDICSIKEN